MTELGSTFKDNCLIGVFSYAVGSWGPEKGSDNSVIMRQQQIYAFVAELWRMSWQPHALSASTLPSNGLGDTAKIAGLLFNSNTWAFAFAGLLWVPVCIVGTHECISVYEWDVRVCLNPESLQVWWCLRKIFTSYLYSCCAATVSYLRGGKRLLHGTSSSFLVQLFGYKVSDEVYLCKILWVGTSQTWRRLLPEPFFFPFFFLPKARLSI